MVKNNKTQKQRREERVERNALLKNIVLARRELECATENFSFATDPTLVDMYSYQIKACQAKYHYLIHEAKSKGVTDDSSLIAYIASR